ncbi:uncharacterized protein LOC131438039 [Malaya genurostris]|uniref:uncharacterized protein LOC131438039 n=1 Tax=Malaya genurostris TaxID=325434 RepID=UPI0026F3FFB5|nr:uncharacterized protein LOC131438039 [Malaya genurostris]XP_058463800.1 uncharacterized protein LOC131438039 [Malaya genurostris]
MRGKNYDDKTIDQNVNKHSLEDFEDNFAAVEDIDGSPHLHLSEIVDTDKNPDVDAVILESESAVKKDNAISTIDDFLKTLGKLSIKQLQLLNIIILLRLFLVSKTRVQHLRKK